LLLFLLYINDLPKNVHDAKVVMFVDDISVLISDSDSRELQIKIDRVVTELETWLNRNDLVINTGKKRSNVVSQQTTFSGKTFSYL